MSENTTGMINPKPSSVAKMFPISFERQDHYDRVLSEENLVDWFRGVTSNCVDTIRNSEYSYVITNELSSNFGGGSTVKYFIEFIIGGYYVKLSDESIKDISSTDCDIYAVIVENSSNVFRSLLGGEINTENKFTALQLYPVSIGSELDLGSEVKDYYKLHILSKVSGSYTIPSDSRRGELAADGGEFN